MASPMATPPPIYPSGPPNRSPNRSIAGPVVLILMGVLFLLGTMGILEIHHLGSLFARFWPALLILWGVLKLIEYEQAKRYGQPARGIGAGGVLLMLFLIVCGLTATQLSHLNWKGLGEHIQFGDGNGLDEIFGGSTFNYSDELTQEVPSGSTLRLTDDHGAVAINVTDGKTIKVSLRKKVRAEKQQDADTYNTQTRPQLKVSDKLITLDANTHGAGEHGVSADMDISIPRNTNLVVTTGHGDLAIAGIVGSIEINHHHGDITLHDQTGSAVLNLDHSAIRAEHVRGDLTVQGRANEVDLEDVDGAVHLSGDFQESVRLVRVSKTVSFHSSRTDMEFSRLDGRLDLDSGDLRADSMMGPTHLATHSKDISLTGVSGDLRLDDRNGTVEISLAKPGNIQIDNHKGDVRISVPPNTALKVDARTREGEIESDFDDIKIDSKDKQASASGSIGTNGTRLVVNCDNGDIEFRKGSAATLAPPATPMAPGRPGKALPAPKAPPVESEN